MPLVIERPSTSELERPPISEAEAVPPQSEPERRRAWWRFRFPWTKTAVGAPMADDELIIANATTDDWVLSLGLRQMGLIYGGELRHVTAARGSQLTARLATPRAGERPLTLALAPEVRAVLLSRIELPFISFYTMKAVSAEEALRTRRSHVVRG